MSGIVISIPANASVEGDIEDIEKKNPENELSGYRKSTSIEDDVRKSANGINISGRNKIRAPRDISVTPPNSEFFYEACPAAIALFWGNGGRKIHRPGPLSMIFAILTHCLN